jgi:hypothetical protein
MAVSRVARANPAHASRVGAWQHPAADAEQKAAAARLATFGRLRTAAATPYDAGLHEAQLRSLWRAAFGIEADDEYAARSARWLELGFQGDDPACDFRGAGVMSLHHLLALLSSRRAPSPATGFPLAVASINATAVLQAYFGLNLRIASPLSAASRPHCPEAALQDLLSRGGLAPLQTLHAELVVHFGRLWGERSSPTVMDFPAIMVDACADLHEVLRQLAESAEAARSPRSVLSAASSTSDAELAEQVGAALQARRWAARYGVSPQMMQSLAACAPATAVSSLMEMLWGSVDFSSCVPCHLCGGDVSDATPSSEPRSGERDM